MFTRNTMHTTRNVFIIASTLLGGAVTQRASLAQSPAPATSGKEATTVAPTNGQVFNFSGNDSNAKILGKIECKTGATGVTANATFSLRAEGTLTAGRSPSPGVTITPYSFFTPSIFGGNNSTTVTSNASGTIDAALVPKITLQGENSVSVRSSYQIGTFTTTGDVIFTLYRNNANGTATDMGLTNNRVIPAATSFTVNVVRP